MKTSQHLVRLLHMLVQVKTPCDCLRRHLLSSTDTGWSLMEGVLLRIQKYY